MHENQCSLKGIIHIFKDCICDAPAPGLLSSDLQVIVPQFVTENKNSNEQYFSFEWNVNVQFQLIILSYIEYSTGQLNSIISLEISHMILVFDHVGNGFV